MIGMVLVTHGLLATEFKAALEHVVGPQKQIETITIGPEDDMELRRLDIMTAVGRVNTGKGVVGVVFIVDHGRRPSPRWRLRAVSHGPASNRAPNCL